MNDEFKVSFFCVKDHFRPAYNHRKRHILHNCTFRLVKKKKKKLIRITKI